ncbi:MAG: tail fiber domain-containing protein [Patescibacteria group bacterium]
MITKDFFNNISGVAKKIAWYSAGFVIGGVAIAGLTTLAAWSDPTAAPTGGNPEAPLNVGPSAQVKEGSFDVNSNLTTHGYLTVSRTGAGAFSFAQLNTKGPTGGCAGCVSTLGYTWRLFTTANDVNTATYPGVNANAFEVWEYPDSGGSYARLQIEDKAAAVTPGIVRINSNGTLQVNKDTATQYNGLQEPTLSLAEWTAGPLNKQAWIQFHNSGDNEAYMRLGKGSGGRRFEFGDSQGAGAAIMVAAPSEGDSSQLNKHFGRIWHSGAVNGNLHIDAMKFNAAGNLVTAGTRGTYLNWFGGGAGVHIGSGVPGVYGNLTAAVVTQTSNRASKEDIAPTTYGINEILQLQPISFRYIKDPARIKHLGLVAEDVAPVIPEVVTFNADGTVLGIDYSKLTVPLINAVKTLDARVDALEAHAESTILKSPNGTCFEVSVGDDGALATRKVECRRE